MEESQPVFIMFISGAALIIDGSHITNPYTPMLHNAYCRHNKITAFDLNAARIILNRFNALLLLLKLFFQCIFFLFVLTILHLLDCHLPVATRKMPI